MAWGSGSRLRFVAWLRGEQKRGPGIQQHSLAVGCVGVCSLGVRKHGCLCWLKGPHLLQAQMHKPLGLFFFGSPLKKTAIKGNTLKHNAMSNPQKAEVSWPLALFLGNSEMEHFSFGFPETNQSKHTNSRKTCSNGLQWPHGRTFRRQPFAGGH